MCVCQLYLYRTSKKKNIKEWKCVRRPWMCALYWQRAAHIYRIINNSMICSQNKMNAWNTQQQWDREEEKWEEIEHNILAIRRVWAHGSDWERQTISIVKSLCAFELVTSMSLASNLRQTVAITFFIIILISVWPNRNWVFGSRLPNVHYTPWTWSWSKFDAMIHNLMDWIFQKK